HTLILGAGISGVASAIALLNHSPPLPFTLYELRPVPSTIGGAIGLTPNALRYLDRLGVLSKLNEKGYGAVTEGIEIFTIHSGRRLGEIEFQNCTAEGDRDAKGYLGLRIMRMDLLHGMLDVLDEKMREAGVGKLVYGKKAVSLAERD